MRAAGVLAAILLSAAAGAQQGDAARAFERANRLFGEHKYQECMDALDEALRLDPKLAPALTLRSRLDMAANRYDAARQDLERAIAADPKSARARFLYGFQFYQQNEMPAAVAALEKARELNPRDPEAALYLGLADEALGRTTEALELYRRAIQLEEAAGAPHVETLLTGARLLLVLGELDDCERLIAKAATVDPQSRDPHFERARLWMRKGDPNKAAEEGETALGLRRGDIADRQVHFLLAQAYRQAGKEADAERHAAAVRALDQGK